MRFLERIARRVLRMAGHVAVPISDRTKAYIVYPNAAVGQIKERGEGVRHYGLVATSATMRSLDEPKMRAAIDAALAVDPQAMPDQSTLRIYYAIKLYGMTKHLTGDAVFIGVSYGKAVRGILEYHGAPNSKVYLVDPWELAEEQDPGGLSYCHDHTVLLENFGSLSSAITPIVGFAPEAIEETKLRFAHINVSRMAAEISSFEKAWNLMVPGGVILVDNFCFPGSGSEDAWIKAAREIGAEFTSLLTGQGFAIKITCPTLAY